MDQNSKNALVVWTGTILGAAGGYWGSARLATAYGLPLGTWGMVTGGLLGAVVGAALTKMVISNPGAIPRLDSEEH